MHRLGSPGWATGRQTPPTTNTTIAWRAANVILFIVIIVIKANEGLLAKKGKCMFPDHFGTFPARSAQSQTQHDETLYEAKNRHSVQCELLPLFFSLFCSFPFPRALNFPTLMCAFYLFIPFFNKPIFFDHQTARKLKEREITEEGKGGGECKDSVCVCVCVCALLTLLFHSHPIFPCLSSSLSLSLFFFFFG